MAKQMNADRVIIDEKIGRDIAEYLELQVTGTLGILLKAKLQSYFSHRRIPRRGHGAYIVY